MKWILQFWKHMFWTKKIKLKSRPIETLNNGTRIWEGYNWLTFEFISLSLFAFGTIWPSSIMLVWSKMWNINGIFGRLRMKWNVKIAIIVPNSPPATTSWNSKWHQAKSILHLQFRYHWMMHIIRDSSHSNIWSQR